MLALKTVCETLRSVVDMVVLLQQSDGTGVVGHGLQPVPSHSVAVSALKEGNRQVWIAAARLGEIEYLPGIIVPL